MRGETMTILQERLKQIWDISSDLELEYEIILSPTVIPYEEYVRFLDVLPYYRNIEEEGVDFSKHSAVIAYFQKEYVKAGLFDKKYSKYISQAFQIRNNVDYADFFMVSRADAEEQYTGAKEIYLIETGLNYRKFFYTLPLT